MAARTLVAKVTPTGEEMGLVLHLKKGQSSSCASFHLSFGRVDTWMIGASNSSTPKVLGVTNFEVEGLPPLEILPIILS